MRVSVTKYAYETSVTKLRVSKDIAAWTNRNKYKWNFFSISESLRDDGGHPIVGYRLMYA